MSAFQALGPFISTFANPNSTGLYFDEDGILRVQPVAEIASVSNVEDTGTKIEDSKVAKKAEGTGQVADKRLDTEDNTRCVFNDVLLKIFVSLDGVDFVLKFSKNIKNFYNYNL